MFADRDEKEQWLSLVKASDTKIVRHVKVRKEANPYDPIRERYFKDRRKRKLEASGEKRWGRLNCEEKVPVFNLHPVVTAEPPRWERVTGSRQGDL